MFVDPLSKYMYHKAYMDKSTTPWPPYDIYIYQRDRFRHHLEALD